MPQLHFYVPDDVAEQIKARAALAKQPVSRYVAELVKRDVSQGWPYDTAVRHHRDRPRFHNVPDVQKLCKVSCKRAGSATARAEG